MESNTLALVITGALTMFSPLAIAWRKKAGWSTLAKVGVPIIVSAALAFAYLWYSGGIVTGGDVVQIILAFYGLQQLAYATFLRWWSTILERVGNPQAEPDNPLANQDDPAADNYLGVAYANDEIPVGVVVRGYASYSDGSESPVERWTRRADGAFVSLDSRRGPEWFEDESPDRFVQVI